MRYFYYDGDRIIAEREGSSWVVRYLLGLRSCGHVVSGQVRVYHADRLGSVRWVTDGSQSIVVSYVYEGFGKVVGQSGGGGGPYQFCGLWGYRNDQDAGLLHVGARYYDPLVGRFISADNYLGEIMNPQSLNRYAYCENDPVNYVDLAGLARVDLRQAIALAQAIANKDVEAVGTIIETITDPKTAKMIEQVMREAIKDLPQKMKTSEGALRSVIGYMKQIISHAQKISANPDPRAVSHWLKEIRTFIINAGKELKLR